ncbi:sorting nexin-27-like [Branchiostoma floridae x Branchiostoma japonicum]
MELGNIVKVSVRTLDLDSSPIQVSVKEESTAGEVLQKVSKLLGIHPENLPLFSLFECIEAPINRLRDQDIVPFTTGLTIQKWCFEPVKEEQVLSRNVDTAAIQLLFLQAQADVREGKLHPNPEQRSKLEEYCDPSFPLHGRYVRLCQTLEDYSSVRFRDVIVERDVCLDNLKVPVGTIVELNLTLSGLRFVIGTATLSIVWSRITSWTNVKEGIHIQYEVYSPDTGSRDILALQTIQAPYLLAATLEIIAALQKEQCGPAFHTSQVHREEEGTITHWDNVLFQK